MHKEDLDLAKDMRKGKDAAFRLFFDRYFPRVYRFCLRRLDEFSAEEVTQTVLVNAIRKIDQYRGEASLFTWLCQIARNEVSTHYRRQEQRSHLVLVEDSEEAQAELESLSADPALTPEGMVDRHQGQAVVQLILDHLPGDYGQILEWKYMHGYSVEEIAQEMATTPVAIQSMLARARNAFRKQYEAMSADVLQLGAKADPGSI
jgi:RNA polymerase sigma-70 factor (ECF subfamily)